MNGKKSAKKISAYQIASAYIGVTIGAGFASGQEVLQFFSFFGPASFAAILLAAFLFAFFAVLILNSGARLKAASHREVVTHAAGRIVGLAVDITITFFLFGSFTAMLAGAGASINQQFGFPPLYGTLFLASIALATVLFGLSGIVSALSFLVPVMIAGIMAVFGAVLVSYPSGFETIGLFAQPWEAVLPFWPLSAITYVSYNLVVAVAILAPMGKMAGTGADIRKGALAGGAGLGMGILAINLSMLLVPESFGYSIPMGYIAGLFSPLVGSGYTMVLLAAIYTTAVGGLYGFSARLTDPASPRFKMLAPIITAAAVGASIIGFTNLVRFLYTGVGIAGFLLLGGLTYEYVRWRLHPGPNPLT
ncbi:MAG: hypothetical protein K6T65_06520 [Peptococcaceae bacterium]|nr:hypothetical protein [Peptococcaceae bacterium]